MEKIHLTAKAEQDIAYYTYLENVYLSPDFSSILIMRKNLEKYIREYFGVDMEYSMVQSLVDYIFDRSATK